MKKFRIRFERLKASPWRLFCFSVFFCFYAPATDLTAQELNKDEVPSVGLRLPDARAFDPRVFPFEKTPSRGLSLRGEVSPFLDWQPFSLKRQTSIDSTGKFITVSEEMNGLPVRQRYMIPLAAYLDERFVYDQQLAWHRAAAGNIYRLGDELRRGPGGVNIEIPVPIKSKAFEQIFGGGTVGLNVQGEISIKGGFRRETRDQERDAFSRGSDNSFKMSQTQSFTVTGRIGEKVTVNVDQDSERAFDFENNIRLNYTGFEDDIVQKIDAGNVSLSSLPGTRFITPSAGLFGIKSEMQIGNLAITAVASQEKGENKRLTLSGGATQDAQRIQDSDYRRYTYFFIDSLYRKAFRNYSSEWIHIAPAGRTISDIVVYKSAAGYDIKPESIRGTALPAEPARFPNEIYPGSFIRLDPNLDYFVDKTSGYIRMTNPLSEDEVLAVAFQAGNELPVGDLQPSPGDSITLRLIKPRSPLPENSTWDLEWKNVYNLGGRDIPREGFDLKIFLRQSSGDPQEILARPRFSNKPLSYLTIFGLDVRDKNGNPDPDKILDDVGVIDFARGELIFPDLRPFDPAGVKINNQDRPSELRDSLRAKFYDKRITDRDAINLESKFYIEVKSQKRSSNYSLGFNVIENSEQVLLNGTKLDRDTDYTIDYFSGNLTILKEDASKPNANVEISYQSNALFQLEKKSILGARAEYRFNQNSFIGGTLMYLNQRTLDQRIRLGSVDSGPMRNLIWDVNTALRFQPNFLSQALNALPFLSTQEPSELRLEGEMAQILPNPNTLNSEIPSDGAGVAYVDDFESAKRTTPLSVNRRAWVQTSIPLELLKDEDARAVDSPFKRKERTALARRGRLIWFNPYSGVITDSIYVGRDVNQTNPTTQVLTLNFKAQNEAGVAAQAWGGIMRALSPGFFDQTESKFLEIWFFGTKGRLHIDLGQVSEDIIPNDSLNTEDFVAGIRDNILDDKEDLGLDGVDADDPADYWDVNRNRRKDWGEPASNDDYQYDSQNDRENYSRINGTEDSKNDANEGGGARRPDTEDINGNGGLDFVNDYISYAFDLDPNSPDNKKYQQGGRATAWKLYRIPLLDGVKSDVARTPARIQDLSRIEYVRIWVDGVNDSSQISIAEISLAGNEWKDVGIGTRETRLDTLAFKKTPKFEVTVVNNEDNISYKSPPGVKREEDKITRLLAKEQSLVLRVKPDSVGARKGLFGDSVVVAQKTFFQPMNLINYNRLKMFVYGDSTKTMSDSVQFFIRFGADTSNFYEFREKVFRGWHPDNEMDISLIDLASLKEDTSARAVPKYENDQFGYRFKRISGTQELRVRGIPALTNIRTLVAGLKNLDPNDDFVGEVWLDELRVTEVKKEKGIALRVRADLKLADFMTINGEINRQDADFHNVAQRFGGGDDRTSYTLGGSMTFDRLLPQGLGLSIPVSMNYSKSSATPKYVPGTDILTNDLKNKDPILYNQSLAYNDQLGVNLSVRRRSRSQNFLVKNTLDNLSGSLSYLKSTGRNSQTLHSQSEAWSGDLGYNLTFGAKNYIQPFKWIGKAPLLGKLTDTKLYYSPQLFSARLQASKKQDSTLTRVAGIAGGDGNRDTTFTAVSDLRTSMKLVENLNLDFSHNFTSDLLSRRREFDNNPLPGKGVRPQTGLLALITGSYEVVGLTQSFGAKYTPNLFSWFSPNLGYSSNYGYTKSIQQRNLGLSARVNRNITASSTLRFSELFRIFKRKESSTGSETPEQKRQAPRLPPGQQQKPENDDPDEGDEDLQDLRRRLDDEERLPPEEDKKDKKDKEQKEKKQEDKPRRSISPLQIFSLLTKFKDVSINVGRSENYFNSTLRDGRRPSWRYQLGLTRAPGVLQIDSLTVPSTFQRSDNLSLRSGFDVSRNFNITVDFELRQSRNENTTTIRRAGETMLTSSTINGSRETFWLRTSELGLSFLPNVDIPFPKWTVRLSGLERIKLFSKFATSLSFDHGFGGRKTSSWRDKDDKFFVTNENFTFSFEPLIRVNMTLKNGMITRIEYSKNSNNVPTYNYTPNGHDGFPQSSSGGRGNKFAIDLKYSKQSGFKLPLPFLKNKELRNSIELEVYFFKNTNKTFSSTGNGPQADREETSQWSLKPSVRYSFSNRVRGGAHFEVGNNYSKRTGNTRIKELGIDITISIRGE